MLQDNKSRETLASKMAKKTVHLCKTFSSGNRKLPPPWRLDILLQCYICINFSSLCYLNCQQRVVQAGFNLHANVHKFGEWPSLPRPNNSLCQITEAKIHCAIFPPVLRTAATPSFLDSFALFGKLRHLSVSALKKYSTSLLLLMSSFVRSSITCCQ